MVLAPGAFFGLGIFIAVLNYSLLRKKKETK
jgi:Na+-translocating ferredoxin:NAD+ oxidoreductase RnfE subunit